MRYLSLIISLLIPNFAYAECNFRTADYLEEMMSPKAIDLIDIEISKSSKFFQNQFKIVSSKSKNIPDSLRKTFKAIITVNYDFGICLITI